jgi:glycosyltransferase involved in cell wall biosynthesis
VAHALSAMPIRIPVPRRFGWPTVGVVIATRHRPNLVRRALASVLAQDYRGPLRVVVVFDGVPPDRRLITYGSRPVEVLENTRTPGPAGARNTGILALDDCQLIALGNDEDTWVSTKLTRQVLALRYRTRALFTTCATAVEYDGRYTPHLAHVPELDVDRLSRDRTLVPRPSGFVARREALVTDAADGGIGLLAEDAPADGEDWDLLLRAARRAPILHLDIPLVRVLWRRGDADLDECSDRIRALRWMIDRHPEIRDRPPAAARIHAEIACWEAAAGRRADAWTATREALRLRWYAPSAARAVVAAAGMLRGARLQAALHRRRLP